MKIDITVKIKDATPADLKDANPALFEALKHLADLAEKNGKT